MVYPIVSGILGHVDDGLRLTHIGRAIWPGIVKRHAIVKRAGPRLQFARDWFYPFGLRSNIVKFLRITEVDRLYIQKFVRAGEERHAAVVNGYVAQCYPDGGLLALGFMRPVGGVLMPGRFCPGVGFFKQGLIVPDSDGASH